MSGHRIGVAGCKGNIVPNLYSFHVEGVTTLCLRRRARFHRVQVQSF